MSGMVGEAINEVAGGGGLKKTWAEKAIVWLGRVAG